MTTNTLLRLAGIGFLIGGIVRLIDAIRIYHHGLHDWSIAPFVAVGVYVLVGAVLILTRPRPLP